MRRIKIDDGCYEIDGRDAEGRRIEVTVHPATLQVIEFEYEDDDEDRPDRDTARGVDPRCPGLTPGTPAPAGAPIRPRRRGGVLAFLTAS